MTKTVATMMAEANAAVERVDMTRARALLAHGAVVIDVRDAPELAANGKVPGSIHIPRGMLEFRADPATPYHEATLQKDQPVLIYCASGGRAALAGKLLQDMGYSQVYNLGGLKDWIEGGGEVER